MKTLSRWVYQERKAAEPWAIHITATKQYRRIRADTEVYADFFNTDSKRMLLHDVDITSNKGCISELNRLLSAYGHPLRKSDVELIEQELDSLKNQFKD